MGVGGVEADDLDPTAVVGPGDDAGVALGPLGNETGEAVAVGALDAGGEAEAAERDAEEGTALGLRAAGAAWFAMINMNDE